MIKIAGNGRPPSKEPKVIQQKMMLSENDVKMLEYCSKATGKSKAEIVRMGIKQVYESLEGKEHNIAEKDIKEITKEGIIVNGVKKIIQQINELDKK